MPNTSENEKEHDKPNGSSNAQPLPRTAAGHAQSPPKALQVRLPAQFVNRYPHKIQSVNRPQSFPGRCTEGCRPAQGIQDHLEGLQLAEQGDEPKKIYAFWETQPVSQFNESPSSSAAPGVR